MKCKFCLWSRVSFPRSAEMHGLKKNHTFDFNPGFAFVEHNNVGACIEIDIIIYVRRKSKFFSCWERRVLWPDFFQVITTGNEWFMKVM